MSASEYLSEFQFFLSHARHNLCSVTCLSPFFPAWAWGDPHFTTLDGADFTFNGWGEYLLLNITNGSTLFELQARTEPVPDSAATQLAAIVFAMLRETLVEVHLVNRELVIYLDGTDRTSMLANTNDTYSTNSLSITRTSPTSILATFPRKIGVDIDASGTMLSFTMIVPTVFQGLTKGEEVAGACLLCHLYIELVTSFLCIVLYSGILGNYNGNPEDDIMFRNGTVEMNSMNDRLIHEVGQSCEFCVRSCV